MISELQALFEYYEKEKGIDRPKMVEALQSALLAASKRSIGPARELRIEIDPDKGSIRAFAKLLVAETVSNPFEEISLKNANRLRKLDSNGDGKISRDEAKGRLRENFDRIDSNSNGYLEPAEMRKALEIGRASCRERV